MSKRDYVGKQLYGAHLRGDQAVFANSNVNDRFSAINRMHIRTLTERACNRFKWLNLPDGVDERYLELTLFYSALAVFFKDKGSDGIFAMKGAASGPPDINMNPREFTITSGGGQFTGRQVSAVNTFRQEGEDIIETVDPDAVPVWSNYLRVPDIDIVLIYAYKLADLDVTIEINAHNARRNKIVAVDENQQLTATNINRQIDQGDNFIKLSNSGLNAVPTTLDLGVLPDTIEKLHILRVRLENECMNLLGVNSANQDKKERLVADEVAANDEMVQTNKNIALNQREAAVEKINKLWGLDIKVMYKSDWDAEQKAEKAAKAAQDAAEAAKPAAVPTPIKKDDAA